MNHGSPSAEGVLPAIFIIAEGTRAPQELVRRWPCHRVLDPGERIDPATQEIVIVQQFRHEYCETELASLRRQAPLARWTVWIGPYAEGELRGGKALASHERCGVARGTALARSALLPLTVSQEERLLNAAPLRHSRRREAVEVAIANRALAGWLADACRAGGFEPVDPAGDAQVAGTILQAAPARAITRIVDLDEAGSATLRDPRPTILLAGFPRPASIEFWQAGGSRRVLRKPVRLDELWAALDELLAATA